MNTTRKRKRKNYTFDDFDRQIDAACGIKKQKQENKAWRNDAFRQSRRIKGLPSLFDDSSKSGSEISFGDFDEARTKLPDSPETQRLINDNMECIMRL